ncbi:metallopeptidase family protein [Candidatus Curtissbacteria bacterium]|nr:metallopeptidase family protein [Candidatus Curtissbacteria bacterium]
MTPEEFQKLVNKALCGLPKVFKEKIENVDIVVEVWPRAEFAQGRLLLGLYQGVPKTTWGRNLGVTIPDKITIFQGPIEWLARGDEQRTIELVIDTVEHEIAHHFGISDSRLAELKR